MQALYWSGMRSFIAVAEHGSFTRAAEALNMSKASLSQQVTTLEQELGVPLLHRTTRKLRLTDIGERYLQQARQGMQQLEAANLWARQESDALEGSIRMNSVGGIIGEEMIAPLLIAFQQQHPEVDLELDFSSQKEDLLASRYDLVLRMGELPDSSLIARRLSTIKTRYVASPKALQQYTAINHPNDLKQWPLIYGSVSEWRFKRTGRYPGDEQTVTIHAQRGFQIANGRAMLAAAKAGLGVARLGEFYVNQAIKDGELVEVLNDWGATPTPLSLVCPPTRHPLARVRSLMDFLVENFKDSSALHHQ